MSARLLAALLLLPASPLARAAVPGLVAHQGRVSIEGIPFDGPGAFKFALVNADGSETWWSHDGTSAAGSEPDTAVALPVVRGLG